MIVNLEGYTDDEFHPLVLEDIENAQICVRFALYSYTPDGVTRLMPGLSMLNGRGIPVCAYLLIPYKWDSRHEATGEKKQEFDKKEKAIEMLKELGVHVNMVTKLHRKQVIIDFKTYWRGSLNPMSQAPGFSDEHMERSHDSYKSLEALIRYKMDKCPICRKIAESEPPNSAFITDAKSVGQIIRANRKALKVPQSKLAKFLGIEPGQISRIERGQHFPKADTMFKIFDAMNLKVAVLPEEMFHLVLWLMEQAPKPLKWHRDKLTAKLSLRRSAASLRADKRGPSGVSRRRSGKVSPASPSPQAGGVSNGLSDGGALQSQQRQDSSAPQP